MAAVSGNKVVKKRKPRPTNAIQITIWPANGGPLTDEQVGVFEEAVQGAQVTLFNEVRTLTQTTRG